LAASTFSHFRRRGLSRFFGTPPPDLSQRFHDEFPCRRGLRSEGRFIFLRFFPCITRAALAFRHPKKGRRLVTAGFLPFLGVITALAFLLSAFPA